VRHVRQDHARRAALFGRAAALKTRFDRAALPRIASASHIVPLHIGEAALCTEVSQRLLNGFGTMTRGERCTLCHLAGQPA
jgi:5-aminolevulinate synthase